MTNVRRTLSILVVLLAFGVGTADAARTANIRSSKHNLSKNGPGTVTATSEDEVCVYCHTPHGATLRDAADVLVKSPLWNRQIPAGTAYSGYTSSSLDAAAIQSGYDGKPGGSSKLCLSCHDGTIAIGQVNVLDGKYNTAQIVSGLTEKMDTVGAGSGITTGFTRDLGVNLANDHPISVTFTSDLATRDGELRAVDANQQYPAGATPYVGMRSPTVKPKLPLEPTDASSTPANKGQVQCASCHDPHMVADSSEVDYQKDKFLRLPRFQPTQPTAGSYTNDIICRVCHNKDYTVGTYAYSAHANSNVAKHTYVSTGEGAADAAALREFPDDLPVWKASCLNCHDTHTVEGARRLLREGTDDISSSPKAGGNPAIEETCYQCHDGSGNVISASSPTGVPNIKSDFSGGKHMPITTAQQANGANGTVEVHDIGKVGTVVTDAGSDCFNQTAVTDGCAKDFVESRTQLGVSAPTNRHAECTDCHNPHRVMKLRLFYGRQSAGNAYGTDWSGTIGAIQTPASLVNPDPEGTHLHVNASGYTHTNIISGVLRGAWGVEPNYSCCSFHVKPSTYTVKRGDPDASTNTLLAGDGSATYVTREYQICLKCHSDYGYSDNNAYPDYPTSSSGRPTLGSFVGGTAAGTNGLHVYTNQAKEFQAPSTHRGEGINKGADGGANGGSTAAYNTNNHRSWHPVMDVTGRGTTARDIASANQWNSPFNNALGAQTMYCTDCHGSNVTSGTSVIPDGTAPDGNPWGPHGSTNDFILKGTWSSTTGQSATQNTALCFKCHSYDTYARGKSVDSGRGCNDDTKNRKTGFSTGTSDRGDLHCYHNEKLSKNLQCTWCHIALPHGWKNKAFLVNLNDVGEEAGQGASSSKEVNINGNSNYYSQEPYYLNAKLKVIGFAQSGAWSASNCGSSNKLSGSRINSTDGNSSNNTNTGKNWMTSTCSSPN